VRVAYYSPLPPERSGIADYSALLLPALQRRVDVVVARRGRRDPARGTDVALYHVGNNPEAHGWIVQALHRRPGVVVLHEFVLHHLVAGMTLGNGDGEAYLRAMEREAGLPGRLLAYGVVDGRVPPPWEAEPDRFPLAGVVLDAAIGLVVHSRHVERLARAAGYAGRLWRIPMPAWPVPHVAPAPVGGSPLVGCFGHLNPSKRIPEALEAFARLRERHPEARLLLVGPAAPRFDVVAEVARHGLAEAVVWHGYVGEERLWSLMAACDVLVSLRAPTMGETSGSVIRALSLGRPLVVSDVGWFSELPDDVALRVPVDEHEVDVLAGALDLLASDEIARRALGAAAGEYARREHDVERVAEAYAAALEVAAGGDGVADGVLGEIARAAAEVGIGVDQPEVAELGRRLRETRIVP
jgi:glycosyltransferase involved in cell wall biosynthesis